MPISSALPLPGTRSWLAVITFVHVLPKSLDSYMPSRYVADASTSSPVPVQMGTSSSGLRPFARSHVGLLLVSPAQPGVGSATLTYEAPSSVERKRPLLVAT